MGNIGKIILENNEKQKRKFIKSVIVTITIGIVLSFFILLVLFIPRTPEISSSFFVINNKDSIITCVVDNEHEEFSFNGKINVPFKNQWKLYSDFNAKNEIFSNSVKLNEGDNRFYLLVFNNNNDKKFYTVIIRRKPMYTVSFNTNGGNYIEDVIIEEGGVIEVPNNPIKVGYKFIGWDYDFSQSVTSNMVVNAQWEADTYTIVFHGNSEDVYGNMEPQIINYGDYCKLNNNAFIKKGYKIMNWNTKSDGTGNSYADGQNVYNLAFDNNQIVNLYAQWQIENYTISYDYNGWTGFVYNQNTYNINSNTIFLNPLNSPARFLGWKDDKGNIITEIVSGSVGNINLIAQWDIVNFKYSLTFDTFNILGLTNLEETDFIIPSGATSISNYAFYNCTSIKSLVIPNSIKSIGSHVLDGCTSLEKLELPFIGDGKTRTNFGYIFGAYSYSEHKSYIPESLKEVTLTNEVYIEDKAFYDCENLTDIKIPSSVSIIGNLAFYGCINMSNVNIMNLQRWCEIDFISQYSNPLVYSGKLYLNGQLITNIEIPDKTVKIKDYAFYNCSNITSIKIPNSVKTIGRDVFYNCINLNSINIPYSVTEIGNSTFSGCGSLTKIEIPNSVTKFGNYMFSRCSNLTTVNIPNCLNNLNGIFVECTSLTQIKIPITVTSIGSSAFWGCTGLRNIEIPNTVKTIGNDAFYNCTNLISLIIPSSVTEIGSGAFNNCSNLKNITIPNSVTSIESGAFSNCTSLIDIEIPNSVKKITSSMFSGCTALTKIKLHNKIDSIGFRAFAGCVNLIEIEIPQSVINMDSYIFVDCNVLKIYCRQSVIPNTWKTSWNYNSFTGYNTCITYMYSESQPLIEGDYWHYVDGQYVIW